MRGELSTRHGLPPVRIFPMLLPLLADVDANSPTVDEKLRALRLGFILITAIGIVGILLIVALVAAWRNFHKRLRELEAERDEVRQSMEPGDAWLAAGHRVEVEPAPEFQQPGGEDDDDYGDEEDEDEPPGWSPDDDEDDDDDRW